MLLALVKLCSGEKNTNFSGEIQPGPQTLFTFHTLAAGTAFPPTAPPHTAHTQSSHSELTAQWGQTLTGCYQGYLKRESAHQNRHTHSSSVFQQGLRSRPQEFSINDFQNINLYKSLVFLVESKECLYVFTETRKGLQEWTNEPSPFQSTHGTVPYCSRGSASTLTANTD